ncbi:unnamed protein product, partial [Oppiella nova]
MSRFDCVDSVEPIEFFALQRAYRADNNHNKVDLIIGTYRSDEGKPWLLPVVHKVEQTLANTDGYNHEYLGQLGDNRFSESVTKLLLGNQCKAIAENRTFGVQTLSGTGALRVGADFLRHNCGFKTIYLTSPCYPNHRLILTRAGFEDIRTYRYWDSRERQLDFDGLIEDL